MATETTNHPAGSANTSDDGLSSITTTSSLIASPSVDMLYPQGVPDPSGTVKPDENVSNQPGNVETMGVGVEGEVVEWEGRYSMKNFIGRLLGMVILSGMWLWLGYEVWFGSRGNLQVLAYATGGVLGLMWLALLTRIMRARFGHYYELTNRRLFVATGIFRRRRDQMELLRVQDVYVQENLMGRIMKVGTVVVVSSEPQFPLLYLAGVNDPKAVMDLVWHHARAERDRRSVKVDQI